MTAPTRAWAALGTQRAVRFISIGMLVYLLVIGALTFGYIKVQSCVTDYSNQAATSTKARAAAAADDRRLNDAMDRLADADRVRYRADDRALTDLLVSVTGSGVSQGVRQAKYRTLLTVYAASAKVLDANEAARVRIRRERTTIEAQRAKNPPPPPPSETC